MTTTLFQRMWPEWIKDPANASDRSSCHGIRDSWKKSDHLMFKPILFLGGNQVGEAQLKSHGVTHVLSIVSSARSQKPAAEDSDCFERLVIDLEDNINADLVAAIREARGFLKEAEAEGMCYVHCEMGRSRSAAVTIAWLMHRRVRQGLAPSLLECMAAVASQRRISALNYGFFARLCDLEVSLGAEQSSLPLISYFLVQFQDLPMRPIPDLAELAEESGQDVNDTDALPRQRSLRKLLNGFNFVLVELKGSSNACREALRFLNRKDLSVGSDADIVC